MSRNDIAQTLIYIFIFGAIFLGGAITGAALAARKMTRAAQRALLQERLQALGRQVGPPSIPVLKLGSAWKRKPDQPAMTEEAMAQIVAARRARSRARIAFRLDHQIAEAADPNFDPRRSPNR